MANFRSIFALPCLILACIAMPLPARAQDAPATRPARCHAVMVVGTPGSAIIARHYSDWAGRFYACLSAGGSLDTAGSVVLSDQKDLPHRTGDATLQGIQAAFTSLANQVQPQDQLVVILIGHGDRDGALAIPGPDLAPQMLAECLKCINCRQQVILDFASCSAAIIPQVQAPGRIIIAANHAGEVNDSDYPEFFLLCLEGRLAISATRPAADKGRDGNLLEVFNTASYEFAQWVTRQTQAKDGWAVEGKRSRAIFARLYSGDDCPPARRMAAGDDAADDVVMPLVPSNDGADVWTNRRLVTEHPVLEDTGKTDGVSAISGEGYTPIAGGKADDVGTLARATVLGRVTPKAP